ncbi:membrane protein [Actinoplanes sp. OR16]|uniref:DMT family transporter n=1 Tax=Actinoplanes sp. OR16 TaxID=946334 RepID=UPI000F6FAD85|nr:DMT family transporter [Actinoplanes sp. OR16]BBH69057.1 membrane protein [Actinoplanes sp. OR16]
MTGVKTGLAAMAATVVVWAGFALSIRGIGASSLTTMDAALLRFTTPVVLLSPWIPRTLRSLSGERPAVIAALCAGAGLPYFAISALGGSLTTAALVGLVIPGVVPVFVALLSYKIWGLRISKAQAAALGVILLGVAASLSWRTGPGIVVLLIAGLIWSVYTLALRATRLDPVGAALVLCAPSALITASLIGSGLAPSHLSLDRDALIYLVVQGIGVGVIASIGYSIAIRRLGPRLAACLGALAPVLTTITAVPLLGEPITTATLVSLVLIVGGVALYPLLKTSTKENSDAAQRRSVVGAHGGVRS